MSALEKSDVMQYLMFTHESNLREGEEKKKIRARLEGSGAARRGGADHSSLQSGPVTCSIGNYNYDLSEVVVKDRD